jgi:ankyrin repeat protein
MSIINRKNKHKYSKHSESSENLDIDTLSILLDREPFLINTLDPITGQTLLMRAVNDNNYQVAEYLIEKGANPNVQDTIGETALHHAVEHSNYKMINLLLEKGANPNIQQISGETAMHIAAFNDEYKVIKLLLLFKANPILSTHNNFFPINYAQERGNTKSVEVLLPLYDQGVCQTSKNSESPIKKFKNDYAIISSRNVSQTTAGLTSYSNRADNYHERAKSFNVKKREHDNSHDSMSFLNQMNNLEERIENIQKEMAQNFSHISKNKLDGNLINIPTPSHNKFYGCSRNEKFTMYGNYINNPISNSSKYNTLMNFTGGHDNSQEIRNFADDNLRIVGLKPEDMTDNPEMSRITYTTIPHNNDECFNTPLGRNQNYSIGLSKVNDSYWNDVESSNIKKIFIPVVQKFCNDTPILAVFPSIKNDIPNYDDVETKISTQELNNIKYFSATARSNDKQISLDALSNNTVEIDFNDEMKVRCYNIE